MQCLSVRQQFTTHHHHVRLLRVVIRNRTYKNIKVPKASKVVKVKVKVKSQYGAEIYT